VTTRIGQGRFDGRTVIVTGGISGIGLAMTAGFAREGANVVAADVGPENEEFEKVKASGGEISYIKTDVTDRAQWESLVASAAEMYGPVDVLMNNAGLTRIGMLHEMNDDDWDLVLNVDLTAVYRGTKAVLPGMIEQGRGVIVNTASTLGLLANHLMSAYVAAKTGVVGLTKQVALDYGKYGIRCNAICPGPTETPNVVRSYGTSDKLAPRGQFLLDSIPLGRMGQPAEIAAAALFLASDEASFVSGAILTVDGAHSVHLGPTWGQTEFNNAW
jgi:3-oxoacyl-[acyl-carrier protein] reductase